MGDNEFENRMKISFDRTTTSPLGKRLLRGKLAQLGPSASHSRVRIEGANKFVE